MSESEKLGPGRKPEVRNRLARDLNHRYGSDKKAIEESLELANSHKEVETTAQPEPTTNVNANFVKDLIDSSINLQVQEIFEEDQSRALNSGARYHLLDDSFGSSGRLAADNYTEESRP